MYVVYFKMLILTDTGKLASLGILFGYSIGHLKIASLLKDSYL